MSAINVVALVGAGALLAVGLGSGPHDALRTVVPVAGGLLLTALVLGAPVLVRRRYSPAWLVGLAAGVANLIPIRGGFGVLEGGVAGTLIAYQATASQAAAAVIVYHAIAFWFQSLGGLLGYALLRDQSHMLALRRRRALRAAQAAPPKRSSTAPALAS